jgi:NTP pyrophosphatase (non-canonical NTP hydrolase)
MPDPPDSSPPDSSTADSSTADSSTPDPPAPVDPPASIEEAIARVTRFRQARDWDKYHTPSHLSRSVSVEASELAEEFLWKDSGDIEAHLRSEEGREAVKDEVGDVLIATLLFCERVGIDPLEALGTKLEKTKKKYPVGDD